MYKYKWKWWYSAVLLLITTVIFVITLSEESIVSPMRTWLFFIFLSFVFLSIAGQYVTGCWYGALVDDRNVVSLSRFQIMAWTVLVLSALIAASLWNVFHTKLEAPLNIAIPETLWFLMGISTSSLVASPLILQGKKNSEPDEKEMLKTFDLLAQKGYSFDKLTNQGQVFANSSSEHARWTDMFTGEETGNAAHLDLNRLQMFFFTVVTLLCYGVTIGHMFVDVTANTLLAGQGISHFPEISEGLVALIGISHTGYLAGKSVSHSKTVNDTQTDPIMTLQPASDDHLAMG